MKVSEWQCRRKKAKSKRRWPFARRGWLARWRASLKVIEQTVCELRDARDMYSTFNTVVFGNPKLDKSNEFLVLIEDMYHNYLLVKLRTLGDTNFRSHSLYNLIEEVLDHTDRVSKEWFISRWRSSLVHKGRQTFADDWGGGRYPARRRLRADLSRLKCACRNARSIVNRYIAHTDRTRRKLILDHIQMNEAVDTVYELWQRYCRLVCGSVPNSDSPTGWERVLNEPIRKQ